MYSCYNTFEDRACCCELTHGLSSRNARQGDTSHSELAPESRHVKFLCCLYSALPISCGHFSPNNPRKPHKARPWGRCMCVFREFEMSPKFYLRSYCIGCNNVLYCTAIYQETIVLSLTHCGQERMAAIFHTPFSNAFSWMKVSKAQNRWLEFTGNSSVCSTTCWALPQRRHKNPALLSNPLWTFSSKKTK